MNAQTINPTQDARESFSGRILTDHQYNKADVFTDLIRSEIHYSGTFKENLSDLSYAFARTEKFDISRADNTLRDVFKLKNGQTMNEMREDLMKREANLELDDQTIELIKDKTREIGSAIKDGNKVTFHRAYTQKAEELATDLGITNAGARRLMTETFRQETNGELYDWGKEMEEKYYRPQIEAEAQERKTSRSNSSSSRSGYGRSQNTNRRTATGPRR